MESQEVLQLSSLLRGYGDKVLRDESKLTLSANLLAKLNKAFSVLLEQRHMLSTSFQISNHVDLNTELLSNLQFLHDFMQRSSSLKVVPDDITGTSDPVDISAFHNLKLLELYKIKAHLVCGLKTHREKLEFLICIHSVDSLSDVLKQQEEDATNEEIWNNLREANFSNNNLYTLDKSLKLVPWLHTLNLSYNSLKNVDVLNCLRNLKHLNLSYNRLESAPKFTGQLCSQLQVLSLRGNFIDEIRNIYTLVNLCELDLRDNCLVDHNVLSPISNLATLKLLNLEGNPLSYHPQHRSHTAIFLHSNTTTVRFVLDRMLLTKSEQKLAGTFYAQNRTKSHIEPSSRSCAVTSDSTQDSKRVRNATISEGGVPVNPVDENLLTSSSDHLETKRQIKELREKLGASWLQQQAGSFVQDVLNIEKSPFPVTSSPYESDFLLHATLNNFQKTETTNEASDYATAADDATAHDDSIYADVKTQEDDTDEDIDLGDGDESLFLATKYSEDREIFIFVTNKRIEERECLTSKSLAHWHIQSLIGCESVCDEQAQYVKLIFDTLRKDRQERKYVLEESERNRLVQVLQKIIDARPKEEVQQTVYQCMKCGVKFKKNLGQKWIYDEQLQCPACESTLIIEDDA